MGIRQRRVKASVLLCAACVPLLNSIARSQVVSIPTVPIGYANNAADIYNGQHGAVSYEYNMGTYDVTANQYCAFLNSVASTGDPYGLWNPAMAGTTNGSPGISETSTANGGLSFSVSSGRGNHPVTWVDFWNATRFTNWLDNGEPVAPEGPKTTENGTYNLTDTEFDSDLLMYNTPSGKANVQGANNDNFLVTRATGASWAIPNDNEWYKAGFYDQTRTDTPYYGGHYWNYPFRSEDASWTEANFSSSDSSPVGAYPYPSYFGTYDQAGDVYEWLEDIADDPTTGQPINARIQRGGSFSTNDPGNGASFESNYLQPFVSDGSYGFRVEQLNTFTTGGLLDVSNRCLILPNPPAGGLANIKGQIQSGYNGGAWNGTTGILSTTAAADTTHLTALGYMINDTGANTGNATGNAIYSTLQGSSTSDGDILVLYTYYGDANLSGSVDGSDYSLIDNGYHNQLTGWYNGDFNYDGVVDGSDYTLIDNTFNMQGGALPSENGIPTTQIDVVTAVPEPSLLSLVGLTAMGLARQTRMKRNRKADPA